MIKKEYPRPELCRDNWLNLNGIWDFEFDFADTLVEQHPLTWNKKNITYNVQKEFSRQINLPFCPESELSGIGYKKFILGCWYRKRLTIEKHTGKRWILNFEAAYYTTHVFVNDKLVCEHQGGYTPFSVDITDYIGETTEIKVHCSGDSRDLMQPSGKQSPQEKSYGCYYTRTTGIWQTVWLEEVPENYVKSLKLTPDCDNACLFIAAKVEGTSPKNITFVAKYEGEVVGQTTCRLSANVKEALAKLELSALHLWSHQSPCLYDLEIVVSGADEEDRVHSYFGMRKIEIDNLGMKLNGRRVFQKLILDQGFYEKGIYTAESDDDLKGDILRSKKLGFNGARLHEKVFERRFLYYADTLGYLVWGEYPNWGFDHSNESGFLHFLPEWLEAVERDYNHPSVIGWCPMNENFDVCGRQQSDKLVKQIYLETKRFDTTRPCIDVSWLWHTETDIYDVHDYTQDLEEFARRFSVFEEGKVYDKNLPDRYEQPYRNQPFFLSEFGGIKWPPAAKGWAYDGKEILTEEQFLAQLKGLVDVIYSNPRICAFCYTQLTDVEQEVNGLYFYDRSNKFNEHTLSEIEKIISQTAKYEEEDRG